MIKDVIKELEDLKLKDIRSYDFENSSPFYDYFVIATANDRQASAAINHLKKLLKEKVKNVEGKGSTWVLVDAGDIIVHIFNEEDREFYGLDKMLLGVKKVD